MDEHKPMNPIFHTLLAIFFFICYQSSAHAEKWSAIGILTTKIQGQEAYARHVEIDDFETLEMCHRVVFRESHSEDFIGQGGTSGKVPKVHWNFDADCVQKRY